MSRNDDDHIGHVPKITPSHDEIASYQRTQSKGSLASSIGEVPDVKTAAGPGMSMTMLVFIFALILATIGWAGFLHQKLQLAERVIKNYELRITDLERQLSVTDESMSESTVALKVKIREMDSEIRKLWDNVWKKNKERLAAHDTLLAQHGQSIKVSDAFIATAKQQMSKSDAVVADLGLQLKKAEAMQSMVAANKQALAKQMSAIEAAADEVNRVIVDISKLDRRVKGTEEWVAAINGFRSQVNREITALKQSVGQMQAP
jgi:chemotaxis protein histidine kinase CheA